MKIKSKIRYVIEYEFGSKFQHESALNSLDIMVKSWKSFYEGTHKKNTIHILTDYNIIDDNE